MCSSPLPSGWSPGFFAGHSWLPKTWPLWLSLVLLPPVACVPTNLDDVALQKLATAPGLCACHAPQTLAAQAFPNRLCVIDPQVSTGKSEPPSRYSPRAWGRLISEVPLDLLPAPFLLPSSVVPCLLLRLPPPNHRQLKEWDCALLARSPSVPNGAGHAAWTGTQYKYLGRVQAAGAAVQNVALCQHVLPPGRQVAAHMADALW